MFEVESNAGIRAGGIPIILWKLDKTDVRTGMVRKGGSQRVWFDDLISIHNENKLSAGIHVLWHIIHRARFITGQIFDVKKPKSASEFGAKSLDRLSESEIAGVIVDHQDLVIAPIQAGKGCEASGERVQAVRYASGPELIQMVRSLNGLFRGGDGMASDD